MMGFRSDTRYIKFSLSNGSDSFWGVYQPKIKELVIYMQLSETPKLGFTGVVNANLLIHGHQKCPKY